MRLLLIAITLSCLAACGYHLQGQYPSANQHALKAASISFKTPGGILEARIVSALGRYNIQQDKNSSTKVSIGTVAVSERNLSLEVKNQTIERELQARVQVDYDNGQLRHETFTQTAVYTHDPLAVTRSERERQLQRQRLLEHLAEQIILRLSQLPPV